MEGLTMIDIHSFLARQLDSQTEAFDEAFAAIDGDSDEDDPLRDPWGEVYEAPLEVRVERRLIVVLTTGGPHVEAVAPLDGDGSVGEVRLIGWWGSERAELAVVAGGSLHRAMEAFAESASLTA